MLVLVLTTTKPPPLRWYGGGWLAETGGLRGRGLVLNWHVVGMSLTSQGSGENKQAPHVCALSPGFVCKVPGECRTPRRRTR